MNLYLLMQNYKIKQIKQFKNKENIRLIFASFMFSTMSIMLGSTSFIFTIDLILSNYFKYESILLVVPSLFIIIISLIFSIFLLIYAEYYINELKENLKK